MRAFLLLLVLAMFNAIASARQVELFDAHWKFNLGDAPNSQSSSLNDKNWKMLDLPHDWSIEQPFDRKLASGTAFLPAGVGWYRKDFITPDLKKGQHLSIRFDGIYMNAHVWINGHDLGTRPNGFLPIEHDLTADLQPPGQVNFLAVRVDHSEWADSRFYTGSGIYRHVWLITTNDVAIDPFGVFVTTPTATTDAASVAVQTSVRSHRSGSVSAVVACEIQQDGKTVVKGETQHAIGPDQVEVFDQKLDVKSPRLWSCEHPDLYQLVTTVKVNDEVVDQVTTPFGIRSIVFDPDRGFLLNGVATKMKGVCLHQDLGCFGAAVARDALAPRLALLKQSGCNAIRTSHNPPPTDLLDLCDEMGFLVMDEAFDEWKRPKRKWIAGWNSGNPSYEGYFSHFEQWGTRDIQTMVRRDRNHPSIVLWSIGNEIDYNKDPYWDPADPNYTPDNPSAEELVPIAKKLKEAVKAEDSTRPVTAALANIAVSNKTGLADVLDVVGYNYQEDHYAEDHKQYPKRCFIGSENHHDYNAWRAVADNEFVTGQFLWTGFDYLGEGGQYPTHGSTRGLLDETGATKPSFYYRQALWSDQPMAYLAVRRGFGRATSRPGRFNAPVIPSWEPPRIDAPVEVVCYTNCEKVELFLNDKSVDTKTRADAIDGIMSFHVPYAAGTLKAVGSSRSKPPCSYEMKTPGEPDRLKLTPESATVAADGRSHALVRIDVVDKDGNLVYSATPDVKIEVSGPATVPATLRALDSADMNSTELFHADHRKAFHGQLLAVVQSSTSPGTITIRASAQDLPPAEVTVRSEK